MTDLQDFAFLFECPVCGAMFWPQNKLLMRAGVVAQDDCAKCLEIQKFVENK